VRAVVAAGPGVVEVVEVSEPEVGEPGDAVVDVRATGICGADLLPVSGGVPNFEWGTVLGHEFVGTILEAGDDVPLRVGTRVVCSSTVSCGRCGACRAAASSQCESMSLFGFSGVYPRLDGGQAERVRVPNAGRLLWPLPADLDDEAAVFVADILPTAMRAVERAKAGEGEAVVVTGAGPVGLLVLLLLRLRTDQVLVVEPDGARRELVASLGGLPCRPERASEAVAELTAGRGAATVVEASGNEPALRLGLELVAGRGTVSVVGAHFNPAAPLDLGRMFAKETTLVFSMGSPTDDRQRAANLILGGSIDPRRIVTHRLALSDAVGAYEAFRSHRATKVILTP
jgi:2-desacetyl-2-hydroxyethyl bacteriochlorophyllide A dehydrogenase